MSAIFLFAPTRAWAVSTNKSVYYPDEEVGVICADDSNNYSIYMVEDDFYFGELSCAPSPSTGSYSGRADQTYSVLEHSPDEHCNSDDYYACAAESFVVGEAQYSVVYPPEPGGGEPAPVEGVVIPKPVIHIVSPVDGDTLSSKGSINYSSQNAAQVNLFYSAKLTEWGGAFVNPDDKVTIAKDVLPSGPYTWDTEGLMPGNFYRIIVEALGPGGIIGQAVSGLFSLDFTPPTYIVKTNPPTTHGADVIISVDASENLKAPSTITVTQAQAKPVSLKVYGQGSHYEGTYSITKGYDGIATVAISGSDAAGNIGTAILSGGTFAVGIDAPPAPHISSPSDNFVVGTSTVLVSGTARGDTAVVLTVNGVNTYTAHPGSDGKFATIIRLDKDIDKGLNVVSASARDQTGLLSAAVSVRVKYNIPPVVTISLPKEKQIVSATTPLLVRASDGNADSLLFTYQIIPAQSFDATQSATSTKNEWDTIGDALPSSSFHWDSTEVEDGQYFLRVIVDDGFVKSYSTSMPFSVHNTLPFFRFEDGRKTITNKSTVKVVGRALTPIALSPRPNIASVEYSVDNGAKWNTAPLSTGAGTAEAAFSAIFSGLSEGTNGILWRVKDSRGMYGHVNHPVILDTVAPKVPVVNSPANNAFITNDSDENISREGLQISISGTVEPQSTVTLQTAAGSILSVKASVEGNFVFHSIDIPQRGVNRFTVSATDEALNVSAPTVVNVVYDNPPTATILSPKPFRGLTGKATLSWDVSDADNDPVRNIALEYRRGQAAFKPLAIDAHHKSFVFDVSAFPEGTDYQLLLTASDGIATGTDLVNFSVDRTPPILTSFTLDTPILGKGGILLAHGEAQDVLSGIENVEYSITEDKPTSYFTALLTKGFLQGDATFTLKYPNALADGTYTIYARAVDAAGNNSPAISHPLVVDTSPPHIGSFDLLTQGVRVAPDGQGAIQLYKGMHTLFEVSLEGDTAAASLLLRGATIPLKHDIVSGLWQATVDSGETDSTPLFITAEDNMHNSFIGTSLGAFNTIPYGSITELIRNASATPLLGAAIKVLVLDEGTGDFVPFSSSGTSSDAKGQYTLALPQGSYELIATKVGYRSGTQKISLDRAAFVNASFSLKKYSGFWGFFESMFDHVFSP